jgi:hypothetical protein
MPGPHSTMFKYSKTRFLENMPSASGRVENSTPLPIRNGLWQKGGAYDSGSVWAVGNYRSIFCVSVKRADHHNGPRLVGWRCAGMLFDRPTAGYLNSGFDGLLGLRQRSH